MVAAPWIVVCQAGATALCADSLSRASSMAVRVRSRPRTSIVSKRGGATLRPVVATLSAPEELSGLQA